MSAAVAAPASLGSWSNSQRRAASRIFAQALLSALPNVPRNRVLLGSDIKWKSEKSILKAEKAESVEKKDFGLDSRDVDDTNYDSDDGSCSSYTESDNEDSSTYFEEV